MKSYMNIVVLVIWLIPAFCLFMPLTNSAPTPLSSADMSIESMPWLEIHKQISVQQLVDNLGEPIEVKTFQHDEAGIQCTFDNVEVWLTGTNDWNTPAAIVRVLISEPGFITYRGIQVGQNANQIFDCYGEKPGYTSNVQGLTFHRFFINNSLDRIIFAVDADGSIAKIGFACTAGGI